MTATDPRIEPLLDALNGIRLGDAEREDDLPHIPGHCWDGISDLIAEDGYRQGGPMNPGVLRDKVETIWQAQEALDFWRGHGDVHEFLTRYGDDTDLTHGAGAAFSLADHYEATVLDTAADILRMRDADLCIGTYRAARVARLASVIEECAFCGQDILGAPYRDRDEMYWLRGLGVRSWCNEACHEAHGERLAERTSR